MPITFNNIQITGGLQLLSSGATPPPGDTFWANVSLLMNNTTTNDQTNNVFLDSSTNNFTVTRNGTPTQGSFTPFTVATNTSYSTSTNGGSAFFNGSASYLTLPITGVSAFAFGTGNFTIEFWANRTGAGSGDRHMVDANNGANYLVRWNSAGNLQFFINGILIISYSFPFTLNQWYHIAVVRNGTTCTLYVNGTSVGTGTSNANISANNTLFIGGQPAASDWYQGYMSSVRLVKGTAVYTGNFTPSTTPLTAIANTSLLLNFTNAGIFDGATKNNLITLGDAKVSTTQAKFGTTSVSFDGTGDALTMPDSDTFTMGSGNFTIEGWVYTGVSNSSMRLLGQMTTSVITSTVSFALYTTSGKMISSAWVGSTFYGAISTSNLPLSQWVHIAFVRNGSTLTQYINGVSDSDGSGANRNIGVNSINNSTNNLSIGRLGEYNAEYWNGFVQDIRITKGVARYTANFTPPTQPFPTY